jgi:hypothetical protein
LIALANAKEDVTVEHAETTVDGKGEGRPTVRLGAGSGDPRTARVGGLDERFGMGFFDDDDLAERAKKRGIVSPDHPSGVQVTLFPL